MYLSPSLEMLSGLEVSRKTQYTFGNTSQKHTQGRIISFWILRITTLKQITRGWKKLEPPKVNKWLEAVEDIRIHYGKGNLHNQ